MIQVRNNKIAGLEKKKEKKKKTKHNEGEENSDE